MAHETSDQKAARLDVERVERNREHLQAARDFAKAPQIGPAPSTRTPPLIALRLWRASLWIQAQSHLQPRTT